jgi:hypothetical protein
MDLNLPYNKPDLGGFMDKAKDALDPSTLMDKMKSGANKSLEWSTKRMQEGRRIIQGDEYDLFAEQLPEAGQKFVKELKALTLAIVDRSRELGKYDPRMALSNSQADVRKMFADMNEARVAGGNYARTQDEWSKLEYTMKTALAPLKDGIASLVADVLRLVNTMIELVPQIKMVPVILGESLALLGKIATFDMSGAIEILENLPRKLADAMKDKKVDFDFSEMIRRTQGLLQQGQRKVEELPARRFDAGRFNFPARTV